MLESLSKGFKVSANLTLISNVKDAILEKFKDENSKSLGKAFMALGPIFMLALNGNINMTFEDFDDIKDHPIMGMLMPTLNELFEGMFDKLPAEMIEEADQRDLSQENFTIQEGDVERTKMRKAGLHVLA